MSSVLSRAERALHYSGAALVCDIDGTLAADVARRHLRPMAEPHSLGDLPVERIERYMKPELVALDAPIEGSALLLATLLASPGRPQPVTVTARWSSLRPTTTAWLEKHYPWLRPLLLMRARNDTRRPSVAVKLELVLRYYRTGVWIDDDPLMLEAAERHGFVALKAPDIYQAANTNALPGRVRGRGERPFLRPGDPRARFLAPTAPARIPSGAPLCLCGPDDDCVICTEEVSR